MDCREMILSEEYADVLTDYEINEDSSFLPMLGDYCYQHLNGVYGILHVNRSNFEAISIANVGYLYIPKCYGLMQTEIVPAPRSQFNPLPLSASGILKVQDRPLELTGRGVIVGMIDTGIRYREPVFQKKDGTSRILAIWDQTVQEGTPPEAFQYGSEYTREEINAALLSDNPLERVPVTDENGHGTAMASVAAGSILENGQQFIGAAPDADLVVVKLKQAKTYLKDYYLIAQGAEAYSDTDILRGIQYVDNFAREFHRPVVFCLGLGTNMGGHDGTGIASRYLSSIANKRSRCLVVCGGNEGNEAHHFEGNILLPSQENFQDMEIRVGEGEEGMTMELWGSPPFTYTVSLRSPAGETVPEISYRENNPNIYTFVYDKTRIIVEYSIIEQSSGHEFIQIRMERPTAGIWTVRVFAAGGMGNANYHVWLPIREFTVSDPYFLRPDPYVTLTVPSLSESSITTSAYQSANNSFYIESGRGFARNGAIKPDFAAPGVSVSTWAGSRTGASMAAALTAGAAAQLLQWAVVEENDTRVNTQDIKNYLIRGALRENQLPYPNREWGYGRLNVAGSFQWLAGLQY